MSATNEAPILPAQAAAISGLETTAPATATEPSTEPTVEPSTEATTATEPAAAQTDAAAATTEAGKEDAVKVEASPITSGNLGYKTGPLKLFKFSQRYFWLGDEAPLEESTIAHFHKGNHENKHHTAAHASQTGKGLLLFAKRAEDKTHPEGIFNLAEVTDVTKEGSVEFFFKVFDKKQSFQATNSTERDGWLVAINNAATEAAASKDSLRESEAYKESYHKYFGAGAPAVAGGATVAAVTAAKNAETGDKPEETVAATEPAPAKKSISRSRSRGPLGLFKQNKEKIENKIEEKKEEKAEEKAAEKEQAKKEEEVAAVGATAAATAAPAAAAADVEKAEKTPTQKKRQSSIFGLFKKNEDKTAATPAKEVESEAPKIDTPIESSTLPTEATPVETAAEPATAAETTPAVEATPAAVESTPVAAAATTPGKKERSPSPKSKGFGGLFSRSDKKATKTEEATPAIAAEPVAPTTVVAEAIPAAEPVAPAAETTAAETTPAEAATETKPTKVQDKRRSSLQAFLGFGKNKDTPTAPKEKEPEVASDGKEAFVDLPKKEKLGGMFRSSSKKAKDTTPATSEAAPPVPVKDTEPVAESAAAETGAIEPAAATTTEDAALVERTGGIAVPGVQAVSS